MTIKFLVLGGTICTYCAKVGLYLKNAHIRGHAWALIRNYPG